MTSPQRFGRQKFCWYNITNIKINSVFHPSGVGKLSTDLSGWG